jgi:sterol 3beta-glucosyltransferase
MKIALHTFGTRGDVQPFVALALELQARGHDVILAAPRDFTDWIEGFGLVTSPIDWDMGDFIRRADKLGLTRNPLATFFHWKTLIKPMMDALLNTGVEGANDADVVIAHPKMILSATGAEAAGAVFIVAAPLPIIVPTTAWPMPATFAKNHGQFWNKLSWKPLDFAFAPYKASINKIRRKLGLEPVGSKIDYTQWMGKPALSLTAVSDAVIARPDDWPSKAYMTGYWSLPESQNTPSSSLDPALEAFLNAGPPPVYIGFGSMVSRDATRLVGAAVAGLKKAGLRGVIARGWAQLPKLNADHVHFIDAAPHDQLFPRCQAIVHHGGAGTVGAALAAGKPSLIVPFMVDQPWWAERLAEQHLGPRALKPARFTANRFSRAIKGVVNDPRYTKNCVAIAAQLAAQNGVQVAADLIEAEHARWQG